ncbi:MAG: N-acetyltransferase family protein [Alphaproteobacteria bacterium]
MAETLTVIFRKATQRDVPRLAELYNESFAQWVDTTKTPDHMAAMVEAKGWNFIVAEDQPGYIAGFALINCNYAATHGVVNLDVMTVDKNARRLGLGQSLLRMTDATAHNAGAQVLTLQVVEYNEPAKKLYLKDGFNFVGKRVGYYSDGTSALEMAKLLPNSFAANENTHPATQRPARVKRPRAAPGN